MNSYDMKCKLLELMGAESLLEELCQAMSEKEALENFEHITNMHDIELDEDIET